jgi:hypothetical protein
VRDLFALSEEANGIFSLRPSGGPPTLVLSFRLRFGYALTLPFKHHLALELGHRSKHIEHQTPGGSTGVYWVSAKVKDAERHALRFKLLHQFRQMPDRASRSSFVTTSVSPSRQ